MKAIVAVRWRPESLAIQSKETRKLQIWCVHAVSFFFNHFRSKKGQEVKQSQVQGGGGQLAQEVYRAGQARREPFPPLGATTDCGERPTKQGFGR